MATVDFARLGYAIDTSGLDRAKASQDALTASGVRLGQAADSAAVAVSEIGAAGKVASASTDRATQSAAAFNAQLLAQGRALAGVSASAEAMTVALTKVQHTSGLVYSDGTKYLSTLAQLRSAMDAEAVSAEKVSVATEGAAGKMSLLGTAAGTVAGIFGYQLLNAALGVVSAIGRIPVEAAHAADAFTQLEARMKYTFSGSVTAAQAAYADILRIARETGAAMPDISENFTQLATSGRAAGMSEKQASRITEAFQLLGQVSGADPSNVARAQYQFSQAVSLNRMSYSQDYRYMEQALPAIGPNLAKSMNLSYGQFVGRMQSGEITGSQLSDAMAKMVDDLRKNLALAPMTLDRAQGQLQTEWTKLLTDMGVSFKASPFFQSLTRGIGDFLHNVDVTNFGTPMQKMQFSQEKAAAALKSGDKDAYKFWSADAAKERVAAAPEIARAAAAQAAQDKIDAETTRTGKITQAMGTSEQLLPNQASRRYLQGLIDQNTAALALNPTAEQAAALRKNISAASAQLEQMTSAFGLLERQTRDAAADMKTYGAGPGLAAATEARSLMEQGAAQGEPITFDAAMKAVVDRNITSADEQQILAGHTLSLQQKFLLPAASGDADAQRQAQIDLQVAQYRDRFPEDQFLTADERDHVGGQVSFQRQLLTSTNAYDKTTALGADKRSDETTLANLREQAAIVGHLGDAGQIEMARLLKKQELLAKFPGMGKDELATELDRTEALWKQNDALQEQKDKYALIVDAAQTAASTVGVVFHTALHDAFEKGRIDFQDIMSGLVNIAERIGDDLIDALIVKPLEKQISNGLLNGLSGGGSSGGGGFLSGIGNLVGSLFGGGAPAGLSASVSSSFGEGLSMGIFANGAAFDAGRVVPFATGGILSRPTTFPMANGMGLAGEAGAEAVIPLKRGTDGKLGVAGGSGGGQTVVQIFDQRSGDAAPVQQSQETGPNGEQIISVFILDTVNKGIQAGKFDRANAAQYGSSRVMKRA